MSDDYCSASRKLIARKQLDGMDAIGRQQP